MNMKKEVSGRFSAMGTTAGVRRTFTRQPTRTFMNQTQDVITRRPIDWNNPRPQLDRDEDNPKFSPSIELPTSRGTTRC